MPIDIRVITQRCWLERFDPGCVSRGRRYAEERRSTLVSIEGQILEAQCQGSEGRDSRQPIRLQPRPRPWEVNGLCSSPDGYHCKAVAAARLTLTPDPRP